ncbi:MAG: hypothetical protein QM651_15090 [Rhodoblastus sp.]
MEDQKPFYASATIWGAGVAALAGVAGIFGYTITPADQAALSDSIAQVVTLVSSVAALGGGVIAIWGRVRASKTIAPKTGA